MSNTLPNWAPASDQHDATLQATAELPNARLTFHVESPMDGDPRMSILLWEPANKAIADTSDTQTWPAIEEVMPRYTWPEPIYAGKHNPSRVVDPLLAKLASEAVAEAGGGEAECADEDPCLQATN